jgi:hypothetical protein
LPNPRFLEALGEAFQLAQIFPNDCEDVTILWKLALLEKIKDFCADLFRNFESISSKNLTIKTPKRVVLATKWNFERGLLCLMAL